MWIFPREEYDAVGQLTQRNVASLIDNLKLNFIFYMSIFLTIRLSTLCKTKVQYILGWIFNRAMDSRKYADTWVC